MEKETRAKDITSLVFLGIGAVAGVAIGYAIGYMIFGIGMGIIIGIGLAWFVRLKGA
jgi:hypothetical protein